MTAWRTYPAILGGVMALSLATFAWAEIRPAEVSKDSVPMAWVADGVFTMGSQEGMATAQPAHEVYVHAFYLDLYEVTTARYAQFLAAVGPDHTELVPMLWEQVDLASHGDKAVVGVTWKAAETYCAWAGKRLPSEAEWEKAARGSDGRQYPWGNEAPTSTLANYDRPVWHDRDIYPDGIKAVGSYESGRSPYGIYDMAGNVSEWVSDWYDGQYYATSPGSNPLGPGSGKQKVLRGGSFGDRTDALKSASRESYFPVDKGPYVGIRCAKDGF